MRERAIRAGLLLIATCCLVTAAAAAQQNVLQLTLPPEFYAVVGQPMNIYYDNIVLTETPEKYRFRFDCPLGKQAERCWTVTAEPSQLGRHRLEVTVCDEQGRPLGKAGSQVRVIPAETGQKRPIKLLIIGDSLTGATAYPNEIARLLSLPGNPPWTMLGTNRPSTAAEGVQHEGYGGWTWAGFVSRFKPDAPATGKGRNSPFVFAGPDGAPSLDLARYFRESCAGQLPDYVTIMLGINDCFRLKPDDRAAIDAGVDGMFKQADVLVDALRKAAPQAELGLCLTTPPNARESGFKANYKDAYHRWGWKRVQHRLVQRQLEHFGGREAEKIFVVPTELNLDPWDGYPENNGVHPNRAGYEQIGATIYAWLKSRLAERP